MTFSSKIKTQISQSGPQAECCMKAEAYGLLLFSHLLSINETAFKTESADAAERLAQLVAAYCRVFVQINEPARTDARPVYTITIPGDNQRLELFELFGGASSAEHIARGNVANPCCVEAFIRGAFLAAGTVSDPNKGYHLEIGGSEGLCAELASIISEKGIKCSTAVRRRSCCVYIKDSGGIEDFLALIGAQDAYFDFVNVKILRELRNTANRRVNCDEANIAKTVSAAARQLSAINKLKASGELEQLPPELLELALLRQDNPEMTLRELGQSLSVPLSRSGVNHRLNKLMELADEGEKNDD